ncbi:hypothetical protein ACFRCI_23485 [Streptomyces sp. NPDC056638]|uniref:hypothetical protein n=1 Tax=Streptomyces sp. NPDC056638 TaxID=3345887 RepID=UPI00367560C2
MNAMYRDSEGDVWMADPHEPGNYFVGDGDISMPIDKVRERYGPLEVRADGSREFVREEESLEALLRRVVREELDRRFGRVHA